VRWHLFAAVYNAVCSCVRDCAEFFHVRWHLFAAVYNAVCSCVRDCAELFYVRWNLFAVVKQQAPSCMAKRGHANTLVKIKHESFTVLAWIDFMSRSTQSRSRTPNLKL